MLFETQVIATVTAAAQHPTTMTAEERKHLGLPTEGDNK